MRKFYVLSIVVNTPLITEFEYRWNVEDGNKIIPKIGQFALVPFGRRKMLGLIVKIKNKSEFDEGRLKNVIDIRDHFTEVSNDWISFCNFAANYYHRSLGEVALSCLPRNLKILQRKTFEKIKEKINSSIEYQTKNNDFLPPKLNDEQDHAVNTILKNNGFCTYLLFGITGSGKTEVYLSVAEKIFFLRINTKLPQILFLVPEINLTPQFENNIKQRFPKLLVVTLNSKLSEKERLNNWILAHEGKASIILGTRLAAFTSLPNLELIVIDEEHEPSYKQQDGLRYSARDLCIWRAKQLKIPIILGSASPSIETWLNAISGKYKLLRLKKRSIISAKVPKIKLVDTKKNVTENGLSKVLIDNLRIRIENGEQSLLFLNRRGYAPILHCNSCGSINKCKNCSTYMVYHKIGKKLQCHLCGFNLPIPRSCSGCGEIDLKQIGKGTQKIEESLKKEFPDARIIRIDADSTKLKGSSEKAFNEFHKGNFDVLIGTQMIVKGHDFKKLSLVGVVNPDLSLFSNDYRAEERLFSQLIQVSGRAGRFKSKNHHSNDESVVIVQTHYPTHHLYQSLLTYDYEGFANSIINERRFAKLPPFIFQAVLKAEAKELVLVMDFLKKAKELNKCEDIIVNEPVPAMIRKIGGKERAQILVESYSRKKLQFFLKTWIPNIKNIKTNLKWNVEVDPYEI